MGIEGQEPESPKDHQANRKRIQGEWLVKDEDQAVETKRAIQTGRGAYCKEEKKGTRGGK